MAVENALEGEAACNQILSEGAQLPIPEQGKEYLLVAVEIAYEEGELDTLNFMEDYPASWEAVRVHFHITTRSGNFGDMLRELPNCIGDQVHKENRM